VRIILKLILEKQGMRMVTKVDWPRVNEEGQELSVNAVQCSFLIP
jgi:hypothetical protein